MKWIPPQEVTAAAEINNAFGGSILLAEQLARRGIGELAQAQAFLDPGAYSQSSPWDFHDMEKAIERIRQAIRGKQHIGIWGDFDVDGQTSTALLLDGLRKLGAQVSFHIPNRARESHGIQPEFLQEFMREGIDLLITCDTGISEMAALQYAADQGLDVIISDHHTLPEQLPAALAIINPHLLPTDHALQSLAGVGTAFQIIRALYERAGITGAEQAYYDLVALGTIADLAELSQENRFYAQMGLLQMNSDLRPALAAILASADYRSSDLSETLIGYTLAPRLNAVGRLDDAGQNVDFLLSEDAAFLSSMANKLEELNNQRKLAVDGVYQSARVMLAQEPALARFPVLVLARSGWEKGVVGIAASKLQEDFNKPVLLMNIQDDRAAGSARSVEGIDIIAAIRANARYLHTFGGHPMAAGLSLDASQLADFRVALSQTIKEMAPALPAEKELQIDSVLPLSNLNLELVREINQLAPFGNGNPPPVLVSRNLEICNPVNLGKNDLHRKLTVRDEQGEGREVLWWNSRDKPLPQEHVNLAYFLRLNEFKGQSTIVLEWIDWQTYEPEKIEVSLPVYTRDVQDLRTATKNRQIDKLLSQTDTCFWGEGFEPGVQSQIPLSNRLELKKSEGLAILTPPPDFTTLQESLKTVKPRQVLLCRLNRPDDNLDGFLNKLAGLIRYAINHYDGKISTSRLAAALCQTPELIELGLDWWQASGEITFERLSDEEYLIRKATHPTAATQHKPLELADKIQKKLDETAAFRSYYFRADPLLLLRKT